MPTPSSSSQVELATLTDTSGFSGHPRGLTTLFFTEVWERFSYYGMRAVLVLYMVAPLAEGGLAFDVKTASSIYGTYTMSVFLTAVPGGLLADRLLGARLAVLLGGIIIACGHFSMIFTSPAFFYTGLVLISVGTGLLKPNISTMVGSLYGENDPRRDSGFSIFYMGINLGAVLAPLVCGFLAQSQNFKDFIASMGFDPAMSWHWAFGAAGVGMTLGLIVYVLQRERIAGQGAKWSRSQRASDERSQRVNEPSSQISQSPNSPSPSSPLTTADWKRVGAIFIFFFFTILFWAGYEQKGASLNLFAKHLVRTEIFGWTFPSAWLQSLTAFFVILLAPIFSWLWIRMGERQPSSPAKFTFGLLFIGLGYVLMVPAAMLTVSGKISPLWVVGLYFLEVMGEMCLSPVGLSTVTKLAPAKLLGIMMGVWFLAAALGNKLAGYLGGFFDASNSGVLMKLYGGIAVGLLISAAVLALLTPSIRKLMGKVH
ncbi:MAG: peptide MFS transporter [candidate division KSB1 bacterium]